MVVDIKIADNMFFLHYCKQSRIVYSTSSFPEHS